MAQDAKAQDAKTEGEKAMEIRIKLLSGLHTSGGAGQAGAVDRDIEADELGLPIVPGRRLKGLLREAYKDVVEALQRSGWLGGSKTEDEIEDEVAALFGRPGRELEETGLFRVGDGELFEKGSGGDWLAWGLEQKGRVITREEIQESFTEVRSQTAMDRESGSAKDNTLRRTRIVRQGLEFAASLRWRVEPTLEQKLLMGLAAAALQRMGLMRTRGLGRVECKLKEGGAKDWTEEALRCLEQGKKEAFGGAGKGAGAQGQGKKAEAKGLPKGAGAGFGSGGGEAHLLRYRVTLESDAVLPSLEGDANTAVTLRSIPGRTLLGVFGWKYLQGKDRSRVDWDGFWRIFGKDVCFLAAYPEGKGPKGRERSLPLPHDLRRLKDEKEQGVEMAEVAAAEKKAKVEGKEKKKLGLKRLKGFGRREGKKTILVGVKAGMSYHHFRAKDRRIGRAVEGQAQESGGVFVYEALKAGQSFQGALIGPKEDLAALKEIWKGGEKGQIGRSRSAEYGGEAAIEWLDERPQPLVARGKQEEGWEGKPRPLQVSERWIVRCLSPLLTVNEMGHPAAVFPQAEVAERLGVEEKQIRVDRSWTRMEWIGGYWSALRLPRPQWPGLAAGSVFEVSLEGLDAKQKEQAAERWQALEREGLGMWRNEGYGQITVEGRGACDPRDIEATPGHPAFCRLGAEKKEWKKKPEAPFSDELVACLAGILVRRVERWLVEKALELSKNVDGDLAGASPSLCGRLLQMVRQNDLKDFVKRLGSFNPKGKAKAALEGSRVKLGGIEFAGLKGGSTVAEFLREAGEKWKETSETWLKGAWSRGLNHFGRGEEEAKVLKEAQKRVGESLVKGFLVLWLGEMQRKAKKKD